MEEHTGSDWQSTGSSSTEPQVQPRVPSIRVALLTLACTLTLLLLLVWLNVFSSFMPPLEQMPNRFAGALAIELISLGLPLAVLFMRGRYSVAASLALHPTTPTALVGATLAGAGLVIVAPQLEAWQAKLFPPPPGYLEGLSDLLSAPDSGSLALALLALAVAPAFLEEALFRGVLLGAIRRRWSLTGSILLTGLLFGLFHLDPYRWLVLTLIGVLISWIAAVSGSLWPAIIAHLANNGLAIILLNCRVAEEQAWVDGVSDVPPNWLVAGVALVCGGMLLIHISAWRGRRLS